MRLAAESAWGERPSAGWTAAEVAKAHVSLSPRIAATRHLSGAAPGVVYAVADVEVAPAADNIDALGAAALSRDSYGEMASYTLQVADSSGAREVRGAFARRLKIRAGIARLELDMAFEFVGKTCAACEAFEPETAGQGERPFSFSGAVVKIDNETIPGREFSVSVNNNIFIGPSDGDNDPAFVSAGRQNVTGYIIVSGDRRDLIDGDTHALAVTMPSSATSARISVPELFFTWCREIRTLSSGALQVLYYEGASSAPAGGVTVALE